MRRGWERKFLMAGMIAAGAGCLLAAKGAGNGGDTLPSGLAGTWRIVRILPTTNTTCWSREQAQPLVGTKLTYRENAMRWNGGEVALEGVATRSVTAAEFSKENSGTAAPASFGQLGIKAQRVLEVDLQHEDADITTATTEVPGDSVLMAAPGRIVVSACGVYYEATRDTGGVVRTHAHH
jgi:hypothetical protein